MVSFKGQNLLKPRPDWSPLGVKFKISDEHPRLFRMGVPPPPRGGSPLLRSPTGQRSVAVLTDKKVTKVRFCSDQNKVALIRGRGIFVIREWPNFFSRESKCEVACFFPRES